MVISMAHVRGVSAAVLLGLTVAGCGYNSIPTYEEQAKAKWADVQNNYQRRADLIPNLVATVQGYAKQEKDVLTAVVEARAKAIAGRLNGATTSDRIKSAYQLLFSRNATLAEVRMGEDFLSQSGQAWNQYVQMLLASSEFSAAP